jgi:hypothetical protein
MAMISFNKWAEPGQKISKKRKMVALKDPLS